jgi:hypothetical protein
MQRNTLAVIAAVLCGFSAKSTDAQLAPEIGYIHPSGAQVGTTVDVTIGGYDWTPDMQLFVHDPRIKLELLGPPTPVLISDPPYWIGAKARGYAWPLPREFRARLIVPTDVAPGLVKWQVANANGVSPVGILHLGTTSEVVEQSRKPSRNTEPQILSALPVTVSGQIQRIEEIDRYQFLADRTGPVTIQLLARQLTSPTNHMSLHPMLKVHDNSGQLLVDLAETEGLDSNVTFSVQANSDYTISLHDLDFAGDRSYLYRMIITPGPGLVAAYPSAGRRGETRSVQFVGYGLTTGSPHLESVNQDVTFPADPNLANWSYVLETPFGTSTPYRFLLSDHSEYVEGMAFGELPCSVTGALETRFGVDNYPLNLKKGETWQISAQSRTVGLPLDLEIRVTDAAGKVLSAADDVPTAIDPELTFTVPEDGTYRVIVADRSGHSGHRGACYRLSVDRLMEDFTIVAPELLAVPLGTSVKVPIAVVRQGGFKGPIELTLDGLPAGVSVPANLVIAEDKRELAIEVTSSADGAALSGLATIMAAATINGVPVRRPVKSLVAATTMKPRIKITPEGLDDVSKVRRGSTHLFPLLIERLDGFVGEIALEMTAKQQRHRQGLASDELVIPADVKRFEYPIFVPEWMETTKTSRMILNGSVKVPDPKGNVRTLLQRMELRLGILPEGAMMKLAHVPGEYQAIVGGELTIELSVSCIPEFQEPLKIEFVPDEIQLGRIVAEPLTLKPGEVQCRMKVHFLDDPALIGEQPLLIRASAFRQGKWLIKSETTVPVEVSAK